MKSNTSTKSKGRDLKSSLHAFQVASIEWRSLGPSHKAIFLACSKLLIGMGSVADPSQEAAASQQSEDWEKVTWASASSEEEGEEEEGEVVTSLDGLADFIKKSLKSFATETKQVLENCQESQECEIKSFAKACAQLQEMYQICDQKDRLIIAGSGNVGKSTIANAFLGAEKFWPTASYRMTFRICEAHYNASSTPEPIPKEWSKRRPTPDLRNQLIL